MGWSAKEFQSLDWVDVYSGCRQNEVRRRPSRFQSLDWVDVYSGTAGFIVAVADEGFNPSTGLMFIPALITWGCKLQRRVSIPRLG